MTEQNLIWRAPGVEPPEELKSGGWSAGMKPSAEHMNWLLTQLAEAAASTGVTVEDLLTSDSAVNALSARQGKVISTNLSTLNTKVTEHLAQNVHTYWLGEVTGLNNLIATTSLITDYFDGLAVSFKVNQDSTVATSLNINGKGAKSIVNSVGAPVVNLRANAIYTARYNSNTGNFILQGEGGGVLNKIQNISIVKSATANTSLSQYVMLVPIEQVDLEKAIILYKGYNSTTNQNVLYNTPFISFENNSTLRIEWYYYSSSQVVDGFTFYLDIVEFDNVKTLQSGEVTIAAVTTIDIETVDKSKSLVFYTQRTHASLSNNALPCFVNLTSNDEILIDPFGRNKKIFWQVIEFY